MRWEICVEKSIGLAYSWRADFKKIYVNMAFLLCFICIWGQFPSISPRGLILRGAIYRRVFCVTSLGGFYFDGFIFGILRY